MSHIFKFDISFPYLQNLAIKFHCDSSHLSISGPSGSGKSSLAKAMAGIVNYRGEICFQGKLLTAPAHQRNFAYMPQDLQLLPHLSTRENILYPKNSELDLQVIEALRLKDLLNRMPRHLSGGEKQRVAIARTLATKADLYIMDEPFSSLDSELKLTAMELVKNYTAQKSLLIISHHDSELKHFDCIDYKLN
jgi:ABC-type molybdate transport system ATPase subunit